MAFAAVGPVGTGNVEAAKKVKPVGNTVTIKIAE